MFFDLITADPSTLSAVANKASVNMAEGFIKTKSIDKKDVSYTQVSMGITSPSDAKVARDLVIKRIMETIFQF